MYKVWRKKKNDYTRLSGLRALLIGLTLVAAAVAEGSEQDLIQKTAARYGIDPALAVAIAQVESNLNHAAVGGLGERGLFQLRPEFHGVAESKEQHVEKAIKYLSYVKRRCKPLYGDTWYVCFNTGPYRKKKLDNSREFAYAKKVRRAMARAASIETKDKRVSHTKPHAGGPAMLTLAAMPSPPAPSFLVCGAK
jgi:hypothetical protein